MKENYQKRMEKIIEGLEKRASLLLHACCAPCASYVTEYLAPHFEITLFYYNPNTHPYGEYLKRLYALETLASRMGLEVIRAEYEDKDFYSAVKGMEFLPEGGARCAECFGLRLNKTALTAKSMGFDMFATTLTVSPHKNADAVNIAGFEAERLCGVKYLPSDFKKKDGYRRSIDLSRQMGLYRQNYCGCEFSVRNSGCDETLQ